MANSMINSINSRVRLSGMTSGLDTDSIIKDMLKADRMKIDKVNQNRQTIQWRKDDYRSVINLFRGFKDEYMDFLKPDTNMRSQSSYSAFNVTSSASSSISAKAVAGAVSGNHTIKATQLATAASTSSTGKAMSSSDITAFNANGKDFNITLNGVTKNISITNGNPADTITDLVANVQSAIDGAYGANRISVSNSGNKLTLDNTYGDMTLTTGVVDDALNLLNIASGTVSKSAAKPLESTLPLDFANFTSDKEFTISLNGQAKTISITGGAYDIDSLKAELQSKIDTAFGSGKIIVDKDSSDSKLVFDAPNSSMIMASGTSNDALFGLNIASGTTNRINPYAKLDKLNTQTALSGNINFKINGVEFNFDATTKSLSEVMNEINSSSAGVTLSYSEVTDNFTLTSDTTGAGTAIAIENISGDFFGANSAINITDTSVSNGTDAIFNLDGMNSIVRNSNTFSVDGVEYSLKEVGVTSSISVEQDVDAVFDKVKTFVDKFNELIDNLNNKLGEEKYRSYSPLTAEQKETMSEDDIKNWEVKAKSGLLRNDSILSVMGDRLKSVAIDIVDGMAANLSNIGIATTNFRDKGKLTINEEKLKDAIRNSPDKVMNLFSKESTIQYSPDLTEAQKSTRYKENGFVNRIFDIVQDNIRTTRDVNGKKGTLIEKAGIVGDVTEYLNYMDKEISKNEQTISDMQQRLYNKEDRLYARFAQMEQALSMMNSQSSWLSQQMGG